MRGFQLASKALTLNPLYTGHLQTGTLGYSGDPDDNADFHQGLHCLLRLKQPSGTEIQHNTESSTCDPLKYKMGNPILIWENPSEYKGLMCLISKMGSC